MINCTFENGNKASLRHTVVDAIIIDNDKILLIKRGPNVTSAGKWAIPGGFVDRDETCEQAIVREVKEETNLDANKVKLLRVNDNPKRKNEDRQNIAFVYIVGAKGKPKGQEGEVDDVKWFDIKDLPPEKDFAFDHYEEIQNFINSK
jgi:8-oxo-dGTP diphosphatase